MSEERQLQKMTESGFALLCGHAAILVGAGAWRLRRSDG
jgi:hypothetical protein